MRIPCPYCGLRSHDEFAYYGDATLRRPTAGRADAEAAFFDYVYLRDNPAGPHREFWYHQGGCHEWLVVDARHAHARHRERRARAQAALSAGEPRVSASPRAAAA